MIFGALESHIVHTVNKDGFENGFKNASEHNTSNERGN